MRKKGNRDVEKRCKTEGEEMQKSDSIKAEEMQKGRRHIGDAEEK